MGIKALKAKEMEGGSKKGLFDSPTSDSQARSEMKIGNRPHQLCQTRQKIISNSKQRKH